MTAPVYPPCAHHAYAADPKGVLLKVPCPVVGCPGAVPVKDGAS